MTNLKVSYADMKDAAGRLRTGQQEIETKLKNLRAYVSQLVSGGFVTTSASGAFDASYAQFNQGATATIAGIEGMARFLDVAAQSLQSTDEQLAAQIRQ